MMMDRQAAESAPRPEADAVPEERDAIREPEREGREPEPAPAAGTAAEQVAGDTAPEQGDEGTKERTGEEAAQQADEEAAKRVGDEAAGEDPRERVAALEAELDQARQEAAGWLGHLQRLQADFDNYRRRSQADRREGRRQAKADLVLRLLPVLDNLDMALAAAGSGGDAGLRRGFELIARQLRAVLGDEGLEPIEALGRPFDPAVHEAVERVETDDHPEDTVVEVVRAGYRLNDWVLRPAMVKVAAAPPAAATTADAATTTTTTAEGEEDPAEESVSEEEGGTVT